MTRQFIEITIISDSNDTAAHPRKGCISVDQIVGFVDIVNPSDREASDFKVKISLSEPGDWVNSDDEVGGVAHCQRTLYVKEDYATVKLLVQSTGATVRS